MLLIIHCHVWCIQTEAEEQRKVASGALASDVIMVLLANQHNLAKVSASSVLNVVLTFLLSCVLV